MSGSNQAFARTRRRFRGIISRPGGPCMAGCWFKLKVEYPRVRAETREAPEGKSPTGGALRRCTNEAVRATRPSQLNSRFRLAEAQCFLQHLGRIPALHGHALHGRMVRDECELTCISRPKPFPALVRIGVGHGPSRKLIPAHVNQYVAGIRSPATAWPRQVCPPRAVCGRVRSGCVRARVGTC